MGCYSELILLPTIEERIRYLQRHQQVAADTFGAYRYLNQRFYSSNGWRSLRHRIIIRDDGCDLGVPGYPVGDRGYIHHIEPITVEQLQSGDDWAFNPENLILCSFETHNEIHYGSAEVRRRVPVDRTPGDTKLW